MKKRLLVFSPSLSTTNAFFPEIPIFQDLTEDFDIYVCCDTTGKKGTDCSFFKDMGITGFFEYQPSAKRKKISALQFHINTLGGRKYLKACGIIYNINKKRYGNLRQRIIHRTLGLSYCSARIANYFFELYTGEDQNIKKIIKSVNPDLMITILSGNTTLEIEAIKSAKLNKIPIVGLQFSWDSLSNRGLMPLQPDYMGVWGYQCRVFAERVQKMPLERIFHIGAFFGDMLKTEPNESDAAIRKRLGIPADKQILFFAGNIWAYNEVRNLKLLDSAIEANKLENCCVLYRPHPFQHKPKDDINFHEQAFKHIYVDPILKGQYATSQQERKRLPFKENLKVDYIHIKELLTVSSITIAPLSTMMIQSAFCGTPAVGLIYVDKANEKYRRRCENDMLDVLRAMPGVSFCITPETLIKRCQRALQSSRDDSTIESMRKYAASTIYSDSLSYSQRLRNVFNAILYPDKYSACTFLSDPLIDIKNKQNVIDFENIPGI